jgi:hypothetical protein
MNLRVHFVGGLCGMTMLRGAEMIEDACKREGMHVRTSIQNVWESPEVRFAGIHVLVQMMPLYEGIEDVLIVSGKPFICRQGEKGLIEQIVTYVKECQP